MVKLWALLLVDMVKLWAHHVVVAPASPGGVGGGGRGGAVGGTRWQRWLAVGALRSLEDVGGGTYSIHALL